MQDPLEGQPGTTFLFEINGRRVFCGGSNWIPADSFLTEISEERYRAWLQLMVDGNQNMVRVWAGGEPNMAEDGEVLSLTGSRPGRHLRGRHLL